MKKHYIFLGGLACLTLASCKVDHTHEVPSPPPIYENPQICDITYTYVPNIAAGAVEPVVTCAVRNADYHVSAQCYMEFRASGTGYKPAYDQAGAQTDYLGDANIIISNGNCYNGETIKLYAECIVNGERLRTLDTGYIPCI